MQVGTLFRTYFVNLPQGSELSLAVVYAAAANKVDEARRLWIEDVRRNKANVKPLTKQQQEDNRKKGLSVAPLVGTGKFLREVASWPIDVTVQQLADDTYAASASLRVSEAVKILREDRKGEREIDFGDIYDELARDGGDDYATEFAKNSVDPYVVAQRVG